MTPACVTCSTCGSAMQEYPAGSRLAPNGPVGRSWFCPVDRRHGDRMWPDAPVASDRALEASR